MGLILFFILILNIVAIVLTYHCLSDLEQKEKMIFIAVGVALMYMLTSVVYSLSTKEIAIKEVSETGKNLITFLFVPINALVILPIFAKSYGKYKIGTLTGAHLRNRGILLGVILLVILIVEFSCFKDVQKGVEKRLQEKYEKRVEVIQKDDTNHENSNNTQAEAPMITDNTVENDITNQDGDTLKEETNEINVNNSIENQMKDNTINEM